MRIRHLKIQNFRGIKDFSQKFNRDFVCLIGRGDSCKTTILEAISLALSPSWSIIFHDTDFHKSNVKEPIEIYVSLTNFPDSFITESKYGLHLRGLNKQNGEIEDELKDDHEKVLTIKLSVDEYLEPHWVITNSRQLEDKPISASDRAKLNCFMVSDYVDRHFSWNKGNPLYSLLKLEEQSPGDENKNIIIEALRGAKSQIDQNNFASLSKTVNRVINKAATLGLNVTNTQTTIDFRELSLKDGKVCLHDEGNIPFRLKGKGSKRLASIAIQLVLAQEGGIVLIDEVEQGLEPDRAKQLARSLKDDNRGQIFVATHSREVITELKSEDLYILHRDKEIGEIKISSLDYSDEKLQAVVRACPEAFFAKKIIVCEGSTEIGICRALDQHRKKNQKQLMSFMDCAYIDGHGNTFFERVKKLLENSPAVSVFCDSDKESQIFNKEKNLTFRDAKNNLVSAGAKFFDCESGKSIEQQVFQDLPWKGVVELIEYALKEYYNSNDSALHVAIKSKYVLESNFTTNWKDSDSPEARVAIAKVSTIKEKEWFKRIDRGEYLGEIIFKYFDQMDDKHLKKMFENLSNWIDE